MSNETNDGMSLRDWFAGTAVDFNQFIPLDIERISDLMLKLGIISEEQHKRETCRRYGIEEYGRLQAWARYKVADAMLAERERSSKS